MFKKTAFLALCAMGLAATATAATAPTVYCTGHINGYLNVVIARSGFTSGSIEIQTKATNETDAAWTKILKTSTSTDLTANGYSGRDFAFATNLVGALNVRVRWCASDTDISDWVDCGVVTGYVRQVGTRIGTSSSPANAFDGKLLSMVDEAGDPWIGYSYKDPIRVRGIRWYGRPDGWPSGACFNRFLNSKFQYADDTTFANPVTILKVNATNTRADRVNEYFFDDPVTVKAIRHLSYQRSSLTEFEVIPADNPYTPGTPTVALSDLTNFWPVVTWTYPANLYAVSARVLRSTSAIDGFAPVSDWTTAKAFTNDTTFGELVAPKVSVKYFYRVEARSAHPAFPDSVVTSDVSAAACRLRRLDRAWGAESALLSGVTVLRQTNGVVSTHYPKAFDGDVSTKPDPTEVVNRNGPLGLDFGEKAWVFKVGYVCRNDNWCYKRIANASVYCSSDTGYELADKTKCSTAFTEYSQTTQFYTKNVDTVPGDGAPKWFLFAEKPDANGFNCNVAEVMFFGYTASDVIASGVLVAPTDVTAVRAPGGTGVKLDWTGAANAETFRVEKRARGTEEWTTLTTVDGAMTTCTDTDTAKGYRQYRVLSVRGEGETEETAASDLCEYAYYTLDDGTGLKGKVFWKYVASTTLVEFVDSRALPDGPVDYTVAQGVPLVEGAPCKNTWCRWRGTVKAPFTGEYTFTLETSDGGSMRVKDVPLCNEVCWTGGAKTGSGSVSLTEGQEADIEIDARLEADTTDGRKCRLWWSGPVNKEIVPIEQLKPAASAEMTVNGLQFTQFGGSKLGRVIAVTGGYRIYTPLGWGGKRNNLGADFLLQPWHGSFDLSAHFKRDENNGTVGFAVVSSEGNVLFATLYFEYHVHHYTLRVMKDGANALTSCGSVDKQWEESGATTADSDIRLTYDVVTKTFSFFYKRDASGVTEWQPVATFVNDGSFGRDFRIGFTGLAQNNPNPRPVPYTITNVRLKMKQNLTIVIR